MYTFLRSYRKFGIQPQIVLPSKNYSATHNRVHFALKYRAEPYGANATRYLARSSLFHGNHFFSLGYSPAYENVISTCYSKNCVRYFRSSERLYEQPSSKVEETVQSIKDKQKEKIDKIMKEAEASAVAASAGAVDPHHKPADKAVVKKSWKTRIWEECLHYYHGFRLLFIDIKISCKLVWRVLRGKKLTRRENNLLVRTTADMFRLIPFSVFIIVPFLEFLLPFFIKFFPGMLPSQFETAKERDAKLRQALQVRLEMAKFLQKTLDEMAVQHKDHKSEEAKEFDIFFQKIKDPNDCVSNEDIIKFAKRFEDEYTLDSLSRQQLAALCRVLELNTVGTSNLLRFQLRVKLRSLAADDRVIAREGVNSLDMWELQNACKARGMRAYGLTVEKMRNQLQEWIELSLNEKVPPTLLLLSRTIFISDECHTTHKLKETLRALPDTLASQTKCAIGELEGKIDNKTKMEIIKEEERKIKEEREEEREEARAIAQEKVDKAPVIDPSLEPSMIDPARNVSDQTMVPDPVQQIILTPAQQLKKDVTERVAAKAIADEEKTLSSKDVELLSDALKNLSNDKKMVVEKETLKDLKEELEEYKEDVEELREVRDVVKEPIHESRAAKMLFKKVNSMIGQLDKVVLDLETKQKLKAEEHLTPEERIQAEDERFRVADIVQIDELIQAIKKLKQTSDESRLKQIENVLSKLDADKDGAISVDEVLKVVEAIGRDNVKLNEKQLEELITLLDKEQIIEAEEKIEKALARSIKEAEEAKKLAEEIKNQAAAETAANAIAAMAAAKMKSDKLIDRAIVVDDKALNLDVTDEKNSPPDAAILKAAEKQKNKILPPPPPPSTSSSS